MKFCEIHFIVGNMVMNRYETNCLTKTCKKNKNKNSWIIKENTHEPIIKKSKYDKVQEIKLGKQAKLKVRHEYLLRDLLYCGNCKRKLQYKIYKSVDKQRFLYESSRFHCSAFYKKKCKNNNGIKEKDLNEIIKNEVIKRLGVIKVEETTNKLIHNVEESNKDRQKIKEYKNEMIKLERKKSILYKNKCEQYITIEEFKIEYEKAKKEIETFQKLMEELQNKDDNKLEEKRIKEMINQLKNGKGMNNEFLKEMIDKIEVDSKNNIEITFNL